MKLLLALSTFFMLAIIVSALPYGQFGSFATGDFGGPSAFGNAAFMQDNRGNRGPVVFPNPPSDQPIESSGVVAGASGFGFVPGQAGANYAGFNYGRRRYF